MALKPRPCERHGVTRVASLLVVPLAVSCGAGTQTAVQAPIGAPRPWGDAHAPPRVACLSIPPTKAPQLDAALVHEPCPPGAPVVTLSVRLSTGTTTCDSNVHDMSFTGPEAQARLACAFAVRDAYAQPRPHADPRVAVAVLRACDAQPLPNHVPTAAVELVARRSSNANLLSAIFAGVDRSCVETTTTEADTDFVPFDDLASCRSAGQALEERDREALEAAMRDGLTWLDGQVKHVQEEIEASRTVLADFDARRKGASRSAVERAVDEIERNRLAREVASNENLLSILRSRRDEEERRTPAPQLVVECRQTRSP
jgi:hypothetical protein